MESLPEKDTLHICAYAAYRNFAIADIALRWEPIKYSYVRSLTNKALEMTPYSTYDREIRKVIYAQTLYLAQHYQQMKKIFRDAATKP